MGDKDKFASLAISAELPPAAHYTDRATELFKALQGATIVAIGTPESDEGIEGGGFVIDFTEPGSTQIRRVIFGFTELGMWVEFDGLRDPIP